MKDDDSSFNVAFVRMVRQYPMLYDNTVQSSKEDKEKAWQSIAEHFEETVSNCVERWRNIRTSLGRSLKNCYQRTSSNRTYRKPYYLAKHLDFLVPFMSHRESLPTRHGVSAAPQPALVIAADDDADEDDDEDDPLYEEDPADSPPETKPFVSSPADEVLLQALSLGRDQRLAAKRQASPSPSPASVRDKDGDQASTRGEEQTPPLKRRCGEDQDDDADWSFLRSLLPDLRAMSPADKLAFKISVLGSINSILYSKST